MKKYLVTGLIILLPAAVTILIVRFFFNLLTEPFVGIVGPLIEKLHLGHAHAWMIQLISQLLVLMVLILATGLIGMLARWFFIHSLLNFGERLLQRIPLISPVYKTSKDIINTIFSDRSVSFKQVVLAPFPSKTALTIGLVSCEKSGDLVAVFIPTTPNPTSGFLAMFKSEDLTYLDLSVEEALKFVISCGVIPVSLNPLSPEQLNQRQSR